MEITWEISKSNVRSLESQYVFVVKNIVMSYVASLSGRISNKHKTKNVPSKHMTMVLLHLMHQPYIYSCFLIYRWSYQFGHTLSYVAASHEPYKTNLFFTRNTRINISRWYVVYLEFNTSLHVFLRFNWNSGFAKIWWKDESTGWYWSIQNELSQTKFEGRTTFKSNNYHYK